ncbi:MAG: hypothetical protein M0R18_03855 [Deltaproteobacteria bacterium]|nr:hypothetical protein [Deltaproteobacteria bacterium]
MNPMRLVTLVIGALFAIFLVILPVALMRRSAADRSARRVRKQFGKAAEALKDYSSEQRDKALDKAKKSLNELDSRIADMEERLFDTWDQMDQEGRAAYRSNLAGIRDQRNRMGEWFGAMSHSSEDAWENIKEGFINSYRDLKSSFEKAQSKGGRE